MNKQNYRTSFLREFTKELIINSRKKGIPLHSYHPVKEETSEFAPNIIQAPQNASGRPTLLNQMPVTPRIAPIRMQIPHPIQFSPNKTETTPMVMPSAQPMPSDFTLEKLDPIIGDNTVTSIECPGPGRFVLVKSLGKVSVTKLSLSEEEIKIIISKFSQTAKIPLIGGIFKAAVGNLVITAVVSEFVGSRFIINKYTPYTILEQAQQRAPFQTASPAVSQQQFQNGFQD